MNNLYILKDDGSDLKKFINILSGHRLDRFNNSQRNSSKRKLIISTILHCYVLIKNDFPLDEIKNMIKRNNISNGVNNYSNSSSNKLFVEVYSSDVHFTVSVDTEKVIDRSESIYNLFFENHKLKRDISRNLKDDFYINWIGYELSIKMGEKFLNESFHVIRLKDYFIGCNIIPDKVETIKLHDILNLIRSCGLI